MTEAVTCRLSVRVQPRAKRPGVQGFREDGVLLVRVGAPPEDGRANAELCTAVAKALGLRPRAVDVVVGPTSRDKVVEIQGLREPEARERLAVASRG